MHIIKCTWDKHHCLLEEGINHKDTNPICSLSPQTSSPTGPALFIFLLCLKFPPLSHWAPRHTVKCPKDHSYRQHISVGWAYLVVLVIKNPLANAGDIRDTGSIPGSGRSPGGRHGKPLHYSCLENCMDRGAWWATVHRVTKSQTQLKWLSLHAQCQIHVLASLVDCYQWL